MPPNILLEVKNISCVRQQKKLFHQLSFALHAGDVLVVEGENGAGKSSLLRLISGLASPTHGEICWHIECDEQLHYLGHSNGIKLGLTVKENLELACRLANVMTDQLSSVLLQLNLTLQQNELAGNLSAGQKRRIGLAKLLLLPKKIWILDEPLTALDANTQQLFLSALEAHAQQGGIAIISSHHPIQLYNIAIQTLRLVA